MPHHDQMTQPLSPAQALVQDLVQRVDEVLQDACERSLPIEIDPHRGRLFELFVMCDATGFLEEGAEHDLTCDGIARELADRWKLARNLGGSLAQASALPPDQLKRLRLLWSFMRMWMEWTYAWHRWDEFHKVKVQEPGKSRAQRGPA